MSGACPLCRALEQATAPAHNDLAVVLPDRYPVSPGHHLVVPRRHEADYFRLTDLEVQAMWALLSIAKHQLDQQFAPDGYNVGINVGEAAGQTIGHVHMHLIPRYAGDRPDPRGGVRWVLPERAAYWSPPER
jgi:diadenosine tetraphosphate (Ap4A) HIT family hydrolase